MTRSPKPAPAPSQGEIGASDCAVVDVRFEGALPPILHAAGMADDKRKLVLEVAQHIGERMVRAVAWTRRRAHARAESFRHRRADCGAGGRSHAGAHHECDWRASG